MFFGRHYYFSWGPGPREYVKEKNTKTKMKNVTDNGTRLECRLRDHRLARKLLQIIRNYTCTA